MKNKKKNANTGIDSQALLNASLRPGNIVDIIFSQDSMMENQDVRLSRLYDIVQGDKLLLAQTTPPALSADTGKMLEITFLIRAKKEGRDHFLRTGYRTKLIKVLPNVDLGGYRESVLAVQAPTEVHEHNLRMHYRINPPSEVRMLVFPRDIRNILERDLQDFVDKAREDLFSENFNSQLMLQDWISRITRIAGKASGDHSAQSAAVHDISFGGAKLAHPADWDYPPKSKLQLTLVWESESIDLDAAVVRTGVIDGATGEFHQFTSVRFLCEDQDVQARLNKLVHEMGRRQLARASGLEK